MQMASRIRSEAPRRSWPIVGAVLAAAGASSCCILPLAGAALGLSTLGASAGALVGGLRPLFLLVAVVLLYLAGRRVVSAQDALRRGTAADGCDCAGGAAHAPDDRARNVRVVMLFMVV